MSSKIFDDFKKCSMTSRNLSTLSGTWKTTASGSPKSLAKSFQVIPLDGPMFVADAVAKYGVDHDTAIDTAVNDLHGGFTVLEPHGSVSGAQPGACVIPVVRHSTPPPV